MTINILDVSKMGEESSIMRKNMMQRLKERRKQQQQQGGYGKIGGFSLTEKSSEEEELLKQIDEKEEELKQIAEMGLRLAEENQELILEIDDLQNKLIQQDQIEGHKEELERIIDELEMEVNETNHQNTYLRRKIEEAAILNHEYLLQLESKERELKEYIRRYEIDGRILEENTKLRNRAEELEGAISLKEKAQKELQSIQNENSLLRSQRVKLESNLNITESKLIRETDRADNLFEELRSIRDKIDNILKLERLMKEYQSQTFWLEKLFIEKVGIKKMIKFYKSTRRTDTEVFLQDINEALISLDNTYKKSTELDLEDLYLNQFESENESIFLNDSSEKQRKLLYISLAFYLKIKQEEQNRQINSLLEEKKELEEEIEELKNQLQRNEIQLQDKTEIKLLKKEIRTIKNQFQRTLELKEAEFNSERLKFNKELENLKEKNKELLKKIENLTSTSKTSITNLKELEKELEEEKLKNSYQESTIDNLKFLLNSSKSQLDEEAIRRENQRKHYEDIISSLKIEKESIEISQKSKLSELKYKNESLENDLKSLKISLETQSKKRLKIEKLKNELQTLIESLKAQVESENREKLKLLDETVELNKKIKELINENLELRKRLEELTSSRNEQMIIIEKEKVEEKRIPDLFERELSIYINKVLKYDRDLNHILPIGIKTNDLIEAVHDGILLCKLMNICFPGSIDERVINLSSIQLQQKNLIMENLNLSINTAKGNGCDIYSIKPLDIFKGDEQSIILITWEIIKSGLLSKVSVLYHPELTLICSPGESIENLNLLSPQEILLRWMNYHLKTSSINRIVTNFGTDLIDSELLAIIMNKLSPKRCPIEAFLTVENLDQRAEMLVSNASKLNVRQFITAEGIVSKEERLNLAFIASLFDLRHGLSLAPNEAKMVKMNYSGTREERSFTIWINSLGVNPKVRNLFEDLRDGRILIQVINKIEPNLVQFNKVNQKPRNLFEKAENCNYALVLAKKLKLHLVSIGGRDILQANKTLVLGIIWQLMRYHIIHILKKLKVLKGRRIDDSQVIKWCNTKINSSGKKNKIKSFRDRNLSNGRYIIDLIFSISPLNVNYNFVSIGDSHEEKLNNALYAISLTRKLGGQIFLLPEDIVEVKEKMLITMAGELMKINKLREN